MSGVGAYGGSALFAARQDATFRSLKAELGSLQVQLTTGKKAETYAGLGSGVTRSLAARQTLSTLDGYASNIADAQLRVKVATQGVARMEKLASSLATSLPGSYSQTPIGQTTAMTSAQDGLRQAIDILNGDVDGRYLYAGRASDAEPVASYDTIVDGDGTRAGLKQLLAERKAADLGASGLGRLTLATTTTGATLSEQGAGLPFGFKVRSATATGTGLAAAASAGPPAAATLSVGTQPLAGDAVAVELGLPDGTTTTLTLTARDPAAGLPAGSFAIGATAADTAANLASALGAALGTAATTTLASASAAKAAGDFFAGSASSPPQRVAGPPYDTATATVAGTAANTVLWYRGDDAAGSARATAPVRTGDGTSVAIGMRANEPGFRALLAALGSLAADDFPATDPTAQGRYAAAAERVGDAVGAGSIRDVAVDLSVANAALGSASARVKASQVQYGDVVDGIENADPSTVASQLLATQTRLQASYQTTSTIAQLSLVNFL